MKTVISLYTTIFFLLMACTIVFANVVPDPVLYLDAADNPADPKAWKNLGTEGGELLAADKPMVLEEGEIKIPALGIVQPNAKYYTAKESHSTFGGPPQKNTPLFFEDWTLEFLCRRNGDFFVEEHHFAGFQNSPREGKQGIRLWIVGGQNLDISVHAGGGKQGVQPLNLKLEEGVWTWIAVVGTSGKSIVAYQDGKEVSEQAGFEFDKKLPINDISIGANSFDERRRTFNGSFAIVRAYDKALTEAEINQNISGTFAVDPADKLSTTWAKVKRGYR
ncbi:MAG: LamG domain-containing protein [Candidatus Poribacteria bacterium]|nr:LamG domain-containing protein [Candidatus Poribacteria bacterium]